MVPRAVAQDRFDGAEAARRSPPQLVVAVTGAVTFFAFIANMTIPALFALAHGIAGSFTATFGALAVMSLATSLLLALVYPRNR